MVEIPGSVSPPKEKRRLATPSARRQKSSADEYYHVHNLSITPFAIKFSYHIADPAYSRHPQALKATEHFPANCDDFCECSHPWLQWPIVCRLAKGGRGQGEILSLQVWAYGKCAEPKPGTGCFLSLLYRYFFI